MYKGTRYRGYVYINPSKMKVIKTVYSDEGIGVDNVYYDNVIHICVYEGRNLLYGKDITKKVQILQEKATDKRGISFIDIV